MHQKTPGQGNLWPSKFSIKFLTCYSDLNSYLISSLFKPCSCSSPQVAFIVLFLIVPIVLDMDSDFPGNLIVNPSDVKVEPLSPQPTHEQLLDIQTELKSEPDIVIKEEPGSYLPKLPTTQHSVLKQPTILISSRPSSSSTRVLYPKLPVKVEGEATGWRLSSPAKFLVNGNHSPHTVHSITTSSSLSHIKSSSRRAIDSHLISSNTVRKHNISLNTVRNHLSRSVKHGNQEHS